MEFIYISSKVEVSAIRQSIADAGYDADDVPANSVLYNNLHMVVAKKIAGIGMKCLTTP